MSKTLKAEPIRPRLHARDYAAKKLGVHLRTVDREIQRGKLKSVHVGRRHLITDESLEALISGEGATS
jgi:excisionase family DNA binding protein